VYRVMFTQRVTLVTHVIHSTMDSIQMEPATDTNTDVTYCPLFCAPCTMSRGTKLLFAQPMKDITSISSCLICGKLNANATQTWASSIFEHAYMDKGLSHSMKEIVYTQQNHLIISIVNQFFLLNYN
jgi:hypothetical protein